MPNHPRLTRIAATLLPLLVWCLALCPATSRAVGSGEAPTEPPPVDKSGYTLFHPVPTAALRDFNPDRPSQADGPYTIDAGHVELEMDFANYLFDSHNPERAPVRIDQWNALPLVVRVGLLERVELEVQYGGYFNVRTRDRTASPPQTTTQSGFGDVTLRTKINVWGNEGGDTALAIIPGLKIPTNTAGLGNRYLEGNVLAPFITSLPADFKLALESGVGFVRNNANTGYAAEFINAAVLTHSVAIKALQGYAEFYSRVDTGHGTPVSGQVDVGLTYQIGSNLQLDGGCNLGVTRAAPDYQPFAGLAVRF